MKPICLVSLMAALMICTQSAIAAEEIVRVGGQGQIDFAVISPALSTQYDRLYSACRRFSRDRNSGTFCKIMMWTDKKNVPKRLPLTDRQMNTQVAVYDFNLMTSLNRLRVLRNGSVIYER